MSLTSALLFPLFLILTWLTNICYTSVRAVLYGGQYTWLLAEITLNAGILRENLQIALEPEAASVYYQMYPTKTDCSNKYMIVDLGGGTVDISVHERVNMYELKELCPPLGGDFGGSTVDKAFLNILDGIVGSDVMEQLQKEEPGAYLDLLREFECAKRVSGLKTRRRGRGKVNFRFPIIIFDKLCLKMFEHKFQDVLTQSKYKDQISAIGDKIRVDWKLFCSFFERSTNSIISKIEEVFRQIDNENEITTILLVGGFSDSPFVRSKICKSFPKKNVISLEDSDLVVLKGAVMFGHKPDFIKSRVLRYTYGRKIRPRFNPDEHDEKKLVVDDGVKRCIDVFEPIIKQNRSVDIGEVVTVQYHTTRAFQETINVALYSTTNPKTKYIDDAGCECLGNFIVRISEPTKEKRNVDVKFTFGRTELMAEAIDHKTGHSYKTEFEFK